MHGTNKRSKTVSERIPQENKSQDNCRTRVEIARGEEKIGIRKGKLNLAPAILLSREFCNEKTGIELSAQWKSETSKNVFIDLMRPSSKLATSSRNCQ